jgi:hypothetical protein
MGEEEFFKEKKGAMGRPLIGLPYALWELRIFPGGLSFL